MEQKMSRILPYHAKALPSWVRFRSKPKAKPIYTVPTVLEFIIQQAYNRLASKMLEDWKRPSPFDQIVEKQSVPLGTSLRIRLPLSYTSTTKDTSS